VSAARQRVTVAAAFVETWLAREGHKQPVGLNLLTKVQLPNLPTLYGAMLAGVSTVIMGAGIPREIPGALDALATHAPATLKFDVEGLARDAAEWLTFDPADGRWPQRAAARRYATRRPRAAHLRRARCRGPREEA
jgi:NAD(P)H-dependent flavin oxidoreductase YrpB (nitropropane dioxygenase family)